MKNRNVVYKLLVATLLAVGMLGVRFATQAASEKSHTLYPQVVPVSVPCPSCRFGMVGITRGQTARLNVVDASEVAPDPCREVELMFLDSQGNVRLRSSECLAPGHAAFLDLNGNFLEAPGVRAEIRAMVHVTPPPEPDRNRVKIIASVEVFDNITGKTSFVIGEPPEPDKR